MIYTRLEAGGRHIDTAVAYENHKEITKGVKQWILKSLGVPADHPTALEKAKKLRNSLFLTTKIWPSEFGSWPWLIQY